MPLLQVTKCHTVLLFDTSLLLPVCRNVTTGYRTQIRSFAHLLGLRRNWELVFSNLSNLFHIWRDKDL